MFYLKLGICVHCPKSNPYYQGRQFKMHFLRIMALDFLSHIKHPTAKHWHLHAVLLFLKMLLFWGHENSKYMYCVKWSRFSKVLSQMALKLLLLWHGHLSFHPFVYIEFFCQIFAKGKIAVSASRVIQA